MSNLLSILLQDGTRRRVLYTAGGIKRESVQSYIQAENWILCNFLTLQLEACLHPGQMFFMVKILHTP